MPLPSSKENGLEQNFITWSHEKYKDGISAVILLAWILAEHSILNYRWSRILGKFRRKKAKECEFIQNLLPAHTLVSVRTYNEN